MQLGTVAIIAATMLAIGAESAGASIDAQSKMIVRKRPLRDVPRASVPDSDGRQTAVRAGLRMSPAFQAAQVAAPISRDRNRPMEAVQVMLRGEWVRDAYDGGGWTASNAAFSGPAQTKPASGQLPYGGKPGFIYRTYTRAPSVERCPTYAFLTITIPGMTRHGFRLVGETRPPWYNHWTPVGFSEGQAWPFPEPWTTAMRQTGTAASPDEISAWMPIGEKKLSMILPGSTRLQDAYICSGMLSFAIHLEGPKGIDPVTGKPPKARAEVH